MLREIESKSEWCKNLHQEEFLNFVSSSETVMYGR